jgi:hypothetical protein
VHECRAATQRTALQRGMPALQRSMLQRTTLQRSAPSCNQCSAPRCSAARHNRSNAKSQLAHRSRAPVLPVRACRCACVRGSVRTADATDYTPIALYATVRTRRTRCTCRRRTRGTAAGRSTAAAASALVRCNAAQHGATQRTRVQRSAAGRDTSVGSSHCAQYAERQHCGVVRRLERAHQQLCTALPALNPVPLPYAAVPPRAPR